MLRERRLKEFAVDLPVRRDQGGVEEHRQEAAVTSVPAEPEVHLPGADEQAVPFGERDRFSVHVKIHLTLFDEEHLQVLMPPADHPEFGIVGQGVFLDGERDPFHVVTHRGRVRCHGKSRYRRHSSSKIENIQLYYQNRGNRTI